MYFFIKSLNFTIQAFYALIKIDTELFRRRYERRKNICCN